MSRTQRFFTRFAGAETAAAMEAHSRAWLVECPNCGHERSIWELGGIRYKAAGNPRTRLRCPKCGQAGWHKVHKAADFPTTRGAGLAARPADPLGHAVRADPRRDHRRHRAEADRGRLTRMRFDALIFDFDGVLLESEWAGNKQIADWLTAHRPSDQRRGVDARVHGPGRARFHRRDRALDRPAAARRLPRRPRRGGCARASPRGSRRWRARSPSSARLPPELPKAICSSSSTALDRAAISPISASTARSAR